jgi:hypothetical protein
MDDAHLNPETRLAPGLYPTDPQGHTLIVGQVTSRGERRSITVANMGGAITIGGVEVTDPDVLDQLADRLQGNAASLRHQQAHPYRPGVPGVEGCAECVGR